MRQFLLHGLSKHRRYVALSCAVVASLALMVQNEGRRKAFAEAVSAEIFHAGQFLFSRASHLAGLSEQNRFLKEWNIQLSLELARLRGVEGENRRLRGLLGLKERGRFVYVAARVIVQDATGPVEDVLIDAGRRDGLRENMPVVVAEGIVGRVSSVREASAVVQQVLDVNSRVSAAIERDLSVVGIVQGDGQGNLQMRNVPLRSEILVGDVVVSSGMGGVFPQGLRIGSVTSVEEERTGLFKELTVESLIRFSQLYEVFVITGEKL